MPMCRYIYIYTLLCINEPNKSYFLGYLYLRNIDRVTETKLIKLIKEVELTRNGDKNYQQGYVIHRIPLNQNAPVRTCLHTL